MTMVIPPEAESAMMAGYLASELEAAIQSMDEMIVYVSEYFRNKWNMDADIVRAREALKSYEAMKVRLSQMPSEAPVEPSQDLRAMPAPPGSRQGHEPSCEAFYGYHCTCQ